MAAQLSNEELRLQLHRRVVHLEHLIAIRAPRRALEHQRKLIEDTRIASGEYKAVSMDGEHEGGCLALV